MNLKLVNGEVVYVKKDGTVSKQSVSTKAILEFWRFPVWGDNVKIICGEPSKDRMVFVMITSGTRWGNYLLSNDPPEEAEVQKADQTYAMELVKNPPPPGASIDKLLAIEKQRRLNSVNLTEMTTKAGLKVWESRQSYGYWCPDYGEFEDLPEGWTFLPKGDGALTKRVRKGQYWVLLRKKQINGKWFTEEIGTLAPSSSISDAFEGLGGEEGAQHRANMKGSTREKREENLTKHMHDTILRLYPSIPPADIKEILATSRTAGHVGKAGWLYICSAQGQEENFNMAAHLAVRAHVRHQYTPYDEMLSNASDRTGARVDNETRMSIRRNLEDEIQKVLNTWQ